MKKIILTLVLFLVVTSTAFAQCWVQVDENEYIDKDSIKYYVDDYGKIDFSKKVCWKKHSSNDIYTELEKKLHKKIAYSLNLLVINNATKKIAIKSSILYDSNGQVVSSDTYKDYMLEWRSIVPNSNGEYWAMLVNKPKILKRAYKFQLQNNNQ